MHIAKEDLPKYQRWFDTLFSTTNGYVLSTQSRQELPYYDRSHTYGEVSFDGFCSLMEEVEVGRDDVFYDLGCGAGKAVVLAAMLYPFKKIVGIEILPDLYHSTRGAVDHFLHGAKTYLNKSNEVEVRLGDITKLTYPEATMVFVHGTCFDNPLMCAIERQLESLPQGAQVISASQLLFSPAFIYKNTKDITFNWGATPVFYYERT